MVTRNSAAIRIPRTAAKGNLSVIRRESSVGKGQPKAFNDQPKLVQERTMLLMMQKIVQNINSQQKNQEGENYFHMIAKDKELAEVFIQLPNTRLYQELFQYSAKIKEALLKNNNYNQTPLYYAAIVNPNEDLFKCFLSYLQSDKTALRQIFLGQNYAGLYFLEIIIEKKQHCILVNSLLVLQSYSTTLKDVFLLKEDKNGLTILHKAVIYEDLEVLKTLIECMKSRMSNNDISEILSTKGKSGKTALEAAQELGYKELVELLEEASIFIQTIPPLEYLDQS